MAVLDSHARVYGVQNLRVVDASSFPFLPPGHPQALVYALAEKVDDLISIQYAYSSSKFLLLTRSYIKQFIRSLCFMTILKYLQPYKSIYSLRINKLFQTI